jgi:hypothetical protein
VNWAPRSSGIGGQFRLLGRIGTQRLKICDFRPQRGIYVLYDDYGPYYVGLTSRAPLGDRLKRHLSDYHTDRWNRFSWFGFRAVSSAPLADGTRALRALPKAPRADSRSAIADIEALLIQSLGTHHRGNAHQEHFRQGDLWEQVMLDDCEYYLGRLERPPPSRARKPEQRRPRAGPR